MLNALVCRCEKKMLWPMKLLNLFIFVISSDLIIRYINRLGRFVRILEDQMEMVGKDRYFQF